LALFEKEAEIKGKIKELEIELENKAINKYKTFEGNGIKDLVIISKWMDELSVRILGEVDRLSQTLAGRVKELAERYAEPMPEIMNEVKTLTKKVDDHLSKMGFNVK